MKIDQEMLNKYASGQCTEDEKLLVEKWLDDDSWDSIDEVNDVKDDVGERIWEDVSRDTSVSKSTRWWTISAAASILVLLGVSFWYLQPKELDANSFANESVDESKFFSEDHYDVVLSGSANAEIDLINSKLVFSGDILIRPKRDFTLQDSDQNILDFKAGRKYIVSNSLEFGKTTLLQKSDVAFLPPLVQFKLREQFPCI